LRIITLPWRTLGIRRNPCAARNGAPCKSSEKSLYSPSRSTALRQCPNPRRSCATLPGAYPPTPPWGKSIFALYGCMPALNQLPFNNLRGIPREPYRACTPVLVSNKHIQNDLNECLKSRAGAERLDNRP
jgi:hypothetical protein